MVLPMSMPSFESERVFPGRRGEQVNLPGLHEAAFSQPGHGRRRMAGALLWAHIFRGAWKSSVVLAGG